MMKSALLLLTFIFTFPVVAQVEEQNSRAPAVMPKECNFEKLTTYMVIVNGKSVIQKRPTEEIEKKELCAEIKKCMFSADEEPFKYLKELEIAICSSEAIVVTPKTPGAVSDKNFDGSRVNKPTDRTAPVISTPVKSDENAPK